jgi:hypothetical protein
MSGPHPGRPARQAIPPLTDHPVQLADLPVGAHRVTVLADRPARALTRIMLADADGRACGDATLHDDTLTVTLPGLGSAADRVAATCGIAHLVHQGGADAMSHQPHAEATCPARTNPAGHTPRGT